MTCPLYTLRVLLKLFALRRLYPLIWRVTGHLFGMQSFCKVCGRKVHDFCAPDSTWAKVEPHIRWGHVLCYDCFCELCAKVGVFPAWGLYSLDETGR